MQSYRHLLVVIVLIIAGWGLTRLWVHPPVADGQGASNLATAVLFGASFPDSAGQTQAIKQWQGKILVVNFWATWCPPCLEEMPELSKLNETYKSQNVAVIGISTDDVAKISAFSKKSPVSYPLLAGDFEAMNLGERLGNNKGALPYTVIVRPDGTIANTYFGRISQSLLEETLLPLIKASDSSH
ncbi:MAG TPA: TlpA disulfide reductase family protein [Methylophilaceae bacterium]|nr:TlpA disulfide reductase family protein [Methylophilaceae bacterium]